MQKFEEILQKVEQGLWRLKESVSQIREELESDTYISSSRAEEYMESILKYKESAEELEREGETLSVEIKGSLSDIKDRYANAQITQVVYQYCKLTANAADTKSELEKTKMLLLDKIAKQVIGADNLSVYEMVVDHVRSKKEETLTDEEFDRVEEVISKKIARGVDAGKVIYDENADITKYQIEKNKVNTEEEKENEAINQAIIIDEGKTECTDTKDNNNKPCADENKQIKENEINEYINSDEHGESDVIESQINNTNETEESISLNKKQVNEDSKNEAIDYLLGTHKNKGNDVPINIPSRYQIPRNIANRIKTINANANNKEQTNNVLLIPKGTFIKERDSKGTKVIEDDSPNKEAENQSTSKSNRVSDKLDADSDMDTNEKIEGDTRSPLVRMMDAATGEYVEGTYHLTQEELPDKFDGLLTNIRFKTYNEKKNCEEIANIEMLANIVNVLYFHNIITEMNYKNNGAYPVMPTKKEIKFLEETGYITECTLDADRMHFQFYALSDAGSSKISDGNTLDTFVWKNNHNEDEEIDIDIDSINSIKSELVPISQYTETKQIQAALLNELASQCLDMYATVDIGCDGTQIISITHRSNTIAYPMIYSYKEGLAEHLELFLSFVKQVYENRTKGKDRHRLMVEVLTEHDKDYLENLVLKKLGLTMSDFDNTINYIVRQDTNTYTGYSANYKHEFEKLQTSHGRMVDMFLDETSKTFNNGNLTFITYTNEGDETIRARRSLKMNRKPNESTLRRILSDYGRELFILYAYTTTPNIVELNLLLENLHYQYNDFKEKEEEHFREGIIVLENKGLVSVYEHGDEKYICMTDIARALPKDDILSKILFSMKSIKDINKYKMLEDGICAQEKMSYNMLRRVADASYIFEHVMKAIRNNKRTELGYFRTYTWVQEMLCTAIKHGNKIDSKQGFGYESWEDNEILYCAISPRTLMDPNTHINWGGMGKNYRIITYSKEAVMFPGEIPDEKLIMITDNEIYEWKQGKWKEADYFYTLNPENMKEADVEIEVDHKEDPNNNLHLNAGPEAENIDNQKSKQNTETYNKLEANETNTQKIESGSTREILEHKGNIAVNRSSQEDHTEGGVTLTASNKTSENAAAAVGEQEGNLLARMHQMDWKQAADYLAEQPDTNICKDAFKVVLEKAIAAYAEGEQRNAIYETLALVKAITVSCPEYKHDLERLALSINSKIYPVEKTGNKLSSLLLEENGLTTQPIIKLLCMLQVLFSHDNEYDHELEELANDIMDDYEYYFNGLKELKSIFSLFTQISKYMKTGFKRGTLSQINNGIDMEKTREKLVEEAKKLKELPQINGGLTKQFPQFLEICFGHDSNMYKALESISAGEEPNLQELRTLLKEYSIDDNFDNGYSEDAMNSYIDKAWNKTLKIKKGPRTLMESSKRQIRSFIEARLDVMREWIRVNEPDGTLQNLEDIITLKNKILSEIEKVIKQYKHKDNGHERKLALFVLKQFRDRLENNDYVNTNENETFITTGHLCLGMNGKPLLEEPALLGIEYYEPWRNVLRHMAEQNCTLEDTCEKIINPKEVGYFDNYGQLSLLEDALGKGMLDEEMASYREMDIESAKKTVQDELKEFIAYLVTEYTYGRITEQTKETLTDEIKTSIQTLERVNNYGAFRLIQEAMKKTVAKETEGIRKRLLRDYEYYREHTSTGRSEALQLAMDNINDGNFIMAEEYMNRMDTDKASDIAYTGRIVDNDLENFLNNEYEELYKTCEANRSSSLRAFGMDYVNAKLDEAKVSVQYRNSSKNLIYNIPNTPEEVNRRVNVPLFLQELGFELMDKQQQNYGYKVIKTTAQTTHVVVSMQPTAKDQTEYSHPIDIFGTNLVNPIDVVFLFGKLQANDIVDRICKLELNRTAIVIVNGAIDLQKRRQIAEKYYRDASGNNPFLLIDWVLLLHLATHARNDRLPLMLKCTLPFTSSYQPFVKKGQVADEMFIGRKSELRQIMDMNGPAIVYGGRQLGKSALLERAVNLTNKPKRKEFALLIRAALIENEYELTRAIIEELTVYKLKLPDPKECSATKLCMALKKLYKDGRISKLWIYIDEADNMLSRFKGLSTPYKPLIAMADLCRSSGSRFKFVLAGLHNVYQAANDPNTIFGQFGMPLCIEPLSAPDALTLLMRPLEFLGFRMDADKMASLIVNTNFYPGIIHHVGYNIVENLMSQYSRYYRANKGNPPFELTEKQLGEIMSSNDLNNHISQLITWTLEADPCYLALSRVVAYLTYEYPEENRHGYNVDRIREYVGLLEVRQVANLNETECRNLLEEMVKMGILVSPNEGQYRIRQRKIMDIIGEDKQQIERKLTEKENEERRFE